MRLKSLDVFRGLTIIIMLLVNFQDGFETVYRPLVHASWDGCTPADMVFPCFLFIVGVTTHLSLAARRQRGATDRELAEHIVKRSVILITLGLFLSAFPFVPSERVVHLRIPGVLQRIGAAYAIAALLSLKTTRRQQIGIIAAILVGYWLVMRLFPLDLPQETLAARVDRYFLAGHIARKGWDRMGVLPTFPAATTVMLGIQAGCSLGASADLPSRARRLAAAGCAGILAGLLWGRVFAINQALWTSSYVLFTGGVAALALSASIWLIDVKKWERWTLPVVIFGTNPILAYMGATMMAHFLYHAVSAHEAGAEITMFDFLYKRFFVSWLTPVNASLAFASTAILLWLMLLYPLHRRRIFLRV